VAPLFPLGVKAEMLCTAHSLVMSIPIDHHVYQQIHQTYR
jgi:hypothetical protein